jgi:hypothetical protein
MATLASASEKNVSRRRRPRMQVWAKRTPFSTLDLSLGRRVPVERDQAIQPNVIAGSGAT